MESLSERVWDVVIGGTGFQQSLLALALSRSGKNVLHVDCNDYYGGSEAAFSLQEADEWALKHLETDGHRVFAAAQVNKESEGLSFSRAYSLALAPQLIHTRSELLSLLVSSKAFRQVEFLAVGSFYIYRPASEPSSTPSLSRIPSTREDVFANTAIPARSKRALMKFLKFVLEYDSEPQVGMWKAKANEPLADFLDAEFKLDRELQSYVVALTLSLDGKISVGAGLPAIHRHLTSVGLFGANFAAVYPKWGGLSEIAQVSCRAGAVGGTVYMLGTGISGVRSAASADCDQEELEVTLTSGLMIRAKSLVQGSNQASNGSPTMSRLTAIVDSSLLPMFESIVEEAPTPCVAVVAFPSGSVTCPSGTSSEFPMYALVHSSDTGECPVGQCSIYLSTVCCPGSKELLDLALWSLLTAVSSGQQPKCLYRLYYEQKGGTGSFTVDGKVGTFALPPVDVAFDDKVLAPVHAAWDMVTALGVADGEEVYMKFEDREGITDEDDALNA